MEKKVLLIAIAGILLLSLSFISAINLDIKTNVISNSVTIELNQPAIFDLTITNNGESDSFEIYSLSGIDITPKTAITIEAGQTKTVQINVMPQESSLSLRKGFQNYEYRIKDSKEAIQKEQLTINTVTLSEAFSLIPESITPQSDKVVLTFKNNIDSDFTKIDIKIISAFFEYEDSFALNSMDVKTITVPLDKEKIKALNAGQYLINAKIKVLGKSADLEAMIKFIEQEGIETSDTNEGMIIKRHEVIKKNIGNVKKDVVITAEKGLLSYLFTTVNIEPTSTDISGFKKHYTWEKQLIPNEEIKVVVKTNWFYPIIIILFIIGIVVLIKKSVETDLVLRKNVSFIKTHGGQFALKVTLKLKAKKFIERVNLIDKLPPLVKLYEKYGLVAPDKIDVQNRRLEWNIESLNKGEARIYSYIIYSKVGVVGRFELPSARAVYEKEGKIKRTESNRSFFINEPKRMQHQS